jgi:hypothetical protein
LAPSRGCPLLERVTSNTEKWSRSRTASADPHDRELWRKHRRVRPLPFRPNKPAVVPMRLSRQPTLRGRLASARCGDGRG